MPHKQKTTYNFGCSLPVNIVDQIDIQRGYYSRSKWILMALENLAATTENKMPLSLRVTRPIETEAIRSLNESIQTQEPVIDHE
jgi:metal-responsive CopG/Arc/MetJ family transcriptional regulator